jgi:hypothetical protein
LGVVRFRVADEDRGADGNDGGYLDPTSPSGQELQLLDPDLYDRLRSTLTAGDRSAATCEVLPKGTVYFDQVLSFADLAPHDRTARIVRRERWFHEAMVAVDQCSLVYLDPDNGLRSDHRSMPLHRGPSEKHNYLSEAGRLLERGQSVVIYHPADRSRPVPAQAESTMADIHDVLGVEPVAAVRASRGATRLFIVIPQPHHRSDLETSLEVLQQTRWSDELRLYRWQRKAALV